jgi:predicted dehydrogenase
MAERDFTDREKEVAGRSAKLKVGIVGYGFMGRTHAACYAALDDVEIAAVVDLDQGRRSMAVEAIGCAVFEDADAMLEATRVDIVDVCSATGAHEGHVLAALGHGKHVICEKPMSLTLESCDRIIAAARAAGTKVMIAQVLRFCPEYQALRELVRSGELGRVQWVSARRLSPVPTWSQGNWITDVGASGGVTLDMHIHDQDFIAELVGPPKRVMALGTPGCGRGDSVQTLGWDHGDGAKSYAEASFALAPGFPFTMSLLVACEKGTIRFDSSQAPSLVAYPASGGESVPKMPAPPAVTTLKGAGNIEAPAGYFNEISYFVDCVKTDGSPEVVTLEDARQAVRICLAARESARTGKIIDL